MEISSSHCKESKIIYSLFCFQSKVIKMNLSSAGDIGSSQDRIVSDITTNV